MFKVVDTETGKTVAVNASRARAQKHADKLGGAPRFVVLPLSVTSANHVTTAL